MTNFKRITRTPSPLAVVISRNMDKPTRCKFCANLKTFGTPEHCPVESGQYEECQKHIIEWLNQEVDYAHAII